MRLLELTPGGKCTLTRDLDHNKVPPYAILSHTWIHGQEVTYEDLVRGKRSSRTSPQRQRRHQNAAGWRKVDFCLAQIQRDGLRHCWIDSCCINKAHPDEKHGAFNAMFAWYQSARVCYVYLHDVLALDDLVGSRWWTRGWTLQELLAPSRVVFFSSEGVPLGDKESLQHVIHAITRISREALLGTLPLAHFTIEEKLSWMKGRQTTYEEDWAYCLQGILGFEMSRRYGEGRLRAIERLKKEAARREAEIRKIARQEIEQERRLLREASRLKAGLEVTKRTEILYPGVIRNEPKGRESETTGAGSRPAVHYDLSRPGHAAIPWTLEDSAEYSATVPPPIPHRSRSYSPTSPRFSPTSPGEQDTLGNDELGEDSQTREHHHHQYGFNPAMVEVTLEDLLAVGRRT